MTGINEEILQPTNLLICNISSRYEEIFHHLLANEHLFNEQDVDICVLIIGDKLNEKKLKTFFNEFKEGFAYLVHKKYKNSGFFRGEIKQKNLKRLNLIAVRTTPNINGLIDDKVRFEIEKRRSEAFRNMKGGFNEKRAENKQLPSVYEIDAKSIGLCEEFFMEINDISSNYSSLYDQTLEKVTNDQFRKRLSPSELSQCSIRNKNIFEMFYEKRIPFFSHTERKKHSKKSAYYIFFDKYSIIYSFDGFSDIQCNAITPIVTRYARLHDKLEFIDTHFLFHVVWRKEYEEAEGIDKLGQYLDLIRFNSANSTILFNLLPRKIDKDKRKSSEPEEKSYLDASPEKSSKKYKLTDLKISPISIDCSELKPTISVAINFDEYITDQDIENKTLVEPKCVKIECSLKTAAYLHAWFQVKKALFPSDKELIRYKANSYLTLLRFEKRLKKNDENYYNTIKLAFMLEDDKNDRQFSPTFLSSLCGKNGGGGILAGNSETKEKNDAKKELVNLLKNAEISGSLVDEILPDHQWFENSKNKNKEKRKNKNGDKNPNVPRKFIMPINDQTRML